MKTYIAKSGETQYKPSINQLYEASQNYEGFCLACGETAYGVEPDMRRGMCDACGAHKVYGAEELMIMGLYYHEE